MRSVASRSLLAMAAVGSIAASPSAQCAAPNASTRSLVSVDFATSTTVFVDPSSPPLYGASIDPGLGIRFDLVLDTAVDIVAIGTNFWNDGSVVTYPGFPAMTFDNLIGGPNGTIEVWISPGGTVLNPALVGQVYSIGAGGTAAPAVPMPMGPGLWTRLSNLTTHLDNLVFAAPDVPSMATFSPPLGLAAGSYAVCCVFIPQGVATGTPATPAMRMHPLLTNMNTIPGVPPNPGDAFMTLDNIQLGSPADGVSSFSPVGALPYMPHLRIDYSVGANVAYQTPYGVGCYDRKQSFYESFAAPGAPASATIDLTQAGRNGLDLVNAGDHYLVTTNTVAGLLVAPGTTAGAIHVNTRVPALGAAWDDAVSGPIAIPFTFRYPGDGGAGTTVIDMSSNGICYLAAATSVHGFYGGYGSFLGNQPAIAAAWCDFEPADLNTFRGGQGQMWVDFDPTNHWVALTWDGCKEWQSATNPNVNLSTVQLVLRDDGAVNLRYGAVAFTAAPVLVGFTPGRGAPDPGTGATPRRVPDLSVAASGSGYRSGNGDAPAVIRLANRPKVGRPLTIDTTNVDLSIGANLTVVSTSSLPGIDLGFLGMPGCGGWVNAPEVASRFQFGSGSFSWPALAAIPGAFAGWSLFAQSVQFSTSVQPFNAANLLVSDALCIHFDNN